MNPHLTVAYLRSYQEYVAHADAQRDIYVQRLRTERELIANRSSFAIPGWCFVCQRSANFEVDFAHSYPRDGELTPNWRERLGCPTCGLNNRMRAAMHILEQECALNRNSQIYVTEQITPLFRTLCTRYPKVIGSEYLGTTVPFGRSDKNGVFNQSITNLTFPSEQFDCVLCFDVFEHVPKYKTGFAECFRCLKPGGRLLFSVPFTRKRFTLVRAIMAADGTVEYPLPPEYHGDPLNQAGCLCFYHFGWDLLDVVNEVGFRNAAALFYWSREYGYLGNGEQTLFTALKPQ